MTSQTGFIGYFIVVEENGDISGMKRFVKPDFRIILIKLIF